MNRILVVPDTHGCLDELNQVLEKANYTDSDFLICLGDTLNRGPKNIECFRFLKEQSDIFIPGNHEIGHCKIFSERIRGGDMSRTDSKKLDLNSQLTKEDIEWINVQPLYKKIEIEGRDWLFVHAGFLPKQKYYENKSFIYTTIRYVNDFGKMCKIETADNPVHWTEMWSQPYSVVYGHQVHNKNYPHTVKKSNGYKTIGLDTGAVFGGKLSILELPSEKIYQADSKRYVN